MLALWTFLQLQDNVFVNVVASIQYRALANKASDAFYKLSNTKSQIQAYVFDGINHYHFLLCNKYLLFYLINLKSLDIATISVYSFQH